MIPAISVLSQSAIKCKDFSLQCQGGACSRILRSFRSSGAGKTALQRRDQRGVGAGRPSGSHADNVDTVRWRGDKRRPDKLIGRITKARVEMNRKNKPSIAVIGAGM